MLARLSPPRRAFVLGLLVVAAAILALLAWRLAGSDGNVRASGTGANRPGPVLLVPGFGGDDRALRSLMSALSASGRTATIVALPGDGTGDLREQADALAAAADAAMQRAGVNRVDIVGYSAGGVVARLWVAKGGGDQFARRVVTLGSPHHGAGVAALANALLGSDCPPACQQLRPDSELLQTLNADDESPDGPDWTAVWTVDDETVTPPSSGRLDGATNIEVQAVCPGRRVTHAALPRDPAVVGLVLNALAGGDQLSCAELVELGGT